MVKSNPRLNKGQLDVLANAENRLTNVSDALTSETFDGIEGKRLALLDRASKRVDKARKTVNKLAAQARIDTRTIQNYTTANEGRTVSAEATEERHEATALEIRIDKSVWNSLSKLMRNTSLLGVEDVVRTMHGVLESVAHDFPSETSLVADLALTLNCADQLQN